MPLMPSLDGELTQDVIPGSALPMTRKRYMDLLRQRAEAENRTPDVSAMQQYAKDRSAGGDAALVNALAAQFAGERFQPVQAQYLKRAAEAQQPMKLGRGMLTAGGQFLEDPFARQTAEVDRLGREIGGLERLMSQEERAAARAQAQKDRQQERLDAKREADEREARLRKELKGMNGNAQPYFQPVQTAQGVYSFNSRTGRMELIPGAGGQPVIGASADPALQGQIAGAKTTATETAKQGAEAVAAGKTSDKLLTALTQAEGILKSGPTASGVGAVRDAAGRVVGVTTDAAQKAAQLETLSGWLVANVPRMEGPQSNYDVQVYQVMAGKVGDRTVPVAERLSALEELRKLQTKYKSMNQNAPAAGAEQLKKRIRFDAQGNEIP